MPQKITGRLSEVQQEIKLDQRDKTIIALLSQNARMPLSQIAKKIRLSRDAVDYRIRRMADAGLILGFVPIFSTNLFGFYHFHVFLLLDEKDQKKKQAFIDYLKVHPSIRNIIEYSDRWDLEVVLIAKSLVEFDRIITSMISSYPEIILEKMRMEVIKYYNSIYVPHIFHRDIMDEKIYIEKPIYTLDDKDYGILSILSKDARTSTYKIAEHVGLSADAVSYRIRRLLAAKYVKSFSVLVNLSMLNYSWYTFAIQLKTLDHKHEMKFKEYVRNHPYIIRAVKTLGNWDLLLYIVTDSPRHFHETVKGLKTEFSDIINNYDTWIAYKEHVYNHLPMVMALEAKKKKVAVFGSFDVIHPGHLSLFRDAKKYGDHLTVVVARDHTILEVKKHKPHYNEKERLEQIKKTGIVDCAVLGSTGDKYKIIEDINPDIICLGYDQTSFTDQLEDEIAKRGLHCKVLRLKPYKEHAFKSSKLKAASA